MTLSYPRTDNVFSNSLIINLNIFIMKKSIIGIRFPKNKAGEPIAAFDLSDGSTLIRTDFQFRADLQQSNLTLDTNNGDLTVDLISVCDIPDGEISGEFTYYKAGSEFTATPEYIASINGALRNVRMKDGSIVEKAPQIGDNIVRTKDGYHVDNGFLTITPNAQYKENLVMARQIARTRAARINGKSGNPTEAISAVE